MAASGRAAGVGTWVDAAADAAVAALVKADACSAEASLSFQASASQNEQEEYFPFLLKSVQLPPPQFSDSASVSCYLSTAEQCCGDLEPWPLQVPEQGLLRPQLGPDPAIKSVKVKFEKNFPPSPPVKGHNTLSSSPLTGGL